MTDWLVTFVRRVDSLSRWGGKLAMGIAVVLFFLLLYEIVVRYGFNAPTIWGTEVKLMLLAAFWLIGGGYALLTRTHVRMDALYQRWSPRMKAIADLATFPLVTIFLVGLIWIGSIHAIDSIMILERSLTSWRGPVYVLKALIPVGFGLLFLQVIAFFIRDLVFVFRGKVLR